MPTKSSEAGSDGEPLAPGVGAEATSRPGNPAFKYFLNGFVIVLGIFFGLIAAFAIGLFLGWIPFC